MSLFPGPVCPPFPVPWLWLLQGIHKWFLAPLEEQPPIPEHSTIQ